MTTVNGDTGMRWSLMDRFARLSCQLLAPICPHYCDYIYRNVVKAGSVFSCTIAASEHDGNAVVLAAADYVRTTAHTLRAQLSTPGNQAKQCGQLFIASRFPKWQDDVIAVLRHSATSGQEDSQFVAALKPVIAEHGKTPGVSKKIIPFAMELRKRVSTEGVSVLERALPFDELKAVEESVEWLRRSLGLVQLEVRKAEEVVAGAGGEVGEVVRKAESAEPGRPSVRLF
jgi:leucyl-tRNA synthetase